MSKWKVVLLDFQLFEVRLQNYDILEQFTVFDQIDLADESITIEECDSLRNIILSDLQDVYNRVRNQPDTTFSARFQLLMETYWFLVPVHRIQPIHRKCRLSSTPR